MTATYTDTFNERQGTDKNKLSGLYAITDNKLICEEDFSKTIEAALRGGVKIIQYRDKSKDRKKRQQQANTLRLLCTEYDALCIINDDIDLAIEVNADGVHLGRDDVDLTVARKKLGPEKIIGISCYNDIDIALAAEKNSADYAAFGTMFSSPTKPDAIYASPKIIIQAKKRIDMPVCAIGGITETNIHQLAINRADMAAVISSLFSSNDIEQAAHKLCLAFNQPGS